MVKILDSNREEITREIKEGRVILTIVGLGRVGLPLAFSFVNEGAHVIGCDINEKLIQRVNRGESDFSGYDISCLLQREVEALDYFCPSCGTKLLKFKGESFCLSSQISMG